MTRDAAIHDIFMTHFSVSTVAPKLSLKPYSLDRATVSTQVLY